MVAEAITARASTGIRRATIVLALVAVPVILALVVVAVGTDNFVERATLIDPSNAATSPEPDNAAAPEGPIPAAVTQPAPDPVNVDPSMLPIALNVEADLFNRTNATRELGSLASLDRRNDLDQLARGWAQEIATSESLDHSEIPESLIGAWSIAGENLGVGYRVADVFNQLEDSVAHYENLIRPEFTALGIGAVRAPDGRIWIVQLFAG